MAGCSTALAGQTTTVTGVIADEPGSLGLLNQGGSGGGGALVVGAEGGPSGGLGGTVVLDASNTYDGGAYLVDGTLHLQTQYAAGTAGIVFSSENGSLSQASAQMQAAISSAPAPSGTATPATELEIDQAALLGSGPDKALPNLIARLRSRRWLR